MPLQFTAIDFETANSHSASACSIGMVKIADGKVVDRFTSLIRPPLGYHEFLSWNVRIHGIRPEDVETAPEFCQLLPELLEFIGSDVLVAHNAGFDMSVIRGCCRAGAVEVPPLDYLCSLLVARKTYQLDSYRLPSAAFAAGFEEFAHHDAAADAEACSAIIVHAATRHGAADIHELARNSGVRLKQLTG